MHPRSGRRVFGDIKCILIYKHSIKACIRICFFYGKTKYVGISMKLSILLEAPGRCFRCIIACMLTSETSKRRQRCTKYWHSVRIQSATVTLRSARVCLPSRPSPFCRSHGRFVDPTAINRVTRLKVAGCIVGLHERENAYSH